MCEECEAVLCDSVLCDPDECEALCEAECVEVDECEPPLRASTGGATHMQAANNAAVINRIGFPSQTILRRRRGRALPQIKGGEDLAS